MLVDHADRHPRVLWSGWEDLKLVLVPVADQAAVVPFEILIVLDFGTAEAQFLDEEPLDSDVRWDILRNGQRPGSETGQLRRVVDDAAAKVLRDASKLGESGAQA